MKLPFLFVSLCLLSPFSFAACDSAAHNEFDFWVGEWDVFNQQGKLAGTNTISKKLNNCVLEEQYSTPSGYAGQSTNIYDGISGQWHQTWVDNGGLLLLLDGKFDGTSMTLSGTGVNQAGTAVLHRISWIPAPDKSVRQHWQSSSDNGKSWNTLFDGKYVKRKK